MNKFERLIWKVRKITNPSAVERLNAYIQKHINDCERTKSVIGEEMFNARWGSNYIEKLKSDLV